MDNTISTFKSLCAQALSQEYSIRQCAADHLRQAENRKLLRERPNLVQSLLGGLSSPDVFVRIDVAKLFSDLGDWTLPFITPLLLNSEPFVRSSALDAIGPIISPQTPPLLALASIDPDPSIRTLARQYLLNQPDWPRHCRTDALLKHMESVLNYGAIEVVEAIRDLLVDTQAVEVLVRALKHPQPQVRRAAVEGLGWLKAEGTFDEMLVCLQDEDWQIREAAVYSLTTCGDRRAIAAISRLSRDPDADVRASVAWALGQFQGSTDNELPG